MRFIDLQIQTAAWLKLELKIVRYCVSSICWGFEQEPRRSKVMSVAQTMTQWNKCTKITLTSLPAAFIIQKETEKSPSRWIHYLMAGQHK